MKTMTIYSVEARGQKDEITTPSLYTYKLFASLDDAVAHLDMIENNVRNTTDKIVIRRDGVVEVRNSDGHIFPRQTWFIKRFYMGIPE